jgi:hypothetical protein
MKQYNVLFLKFVEFTNKLNDDGVSLKEYKYCFYSKFTDCYGTRWKLSFSLGKHTAVFLAEMHTIKACAVENLHRNNINRNIYILPDTKAAIKIFDNYHINTKLV